MLLANALLAAAPRCCARIPSRAAREDQGHARQAAFGKRCLNLAALPWATYLSWAVRERHDHVLCSRHGRARCLEVFRHRSAKSLQRSPRLSHRTPRPHRIAIAYGAPLWLWAFRFRHMVRPERSGAGQRSGLIIGQTDGSVRFQWPGTALGCAETTCPAVPGVPETRPTYQPRKVR